MDATFKIRLSKEELESWKALAKQMNISVASLIRDAIAQYPKPVPTSPKAAPTTFVPVPTKPVLTEKVVPTSKHHPRCTCYTCKPPKSTKGMGG